jgi:hypothetical protein
MFFGSNSSQILIQVALASSMNSPYALVGDKIYLDWNGSSKPILGLYHMIPYVWMFQFPSTQ